MAFDAFLKIEGISGESRDEKHKDWIEILSYQWGEQKPTSITDVPPGVERHERTRFSDFSCVKVLDKASPMIALACSASSHIKEVVVELRQTSGDKAVFMEYRLTDCIISSVSHGGSGGGEATESVTFNYGTVQWIYTQQKPDGSAGGRVAAGWNLELNKELQAQSSG